MHSPLFFKNHKARREMVLRKMATMRAAKEHKRIERAEAGLNEPERGPRWYPLELGVRDKRNGQVAWIDLRSVRDAAKRLNVVLKFCQ